MSYRIEIACNPTFELVISLFAYAKKNVMKGTALGSDWRKSVKSSLSISLSQELDAADLDDFNGLDLLIAVCPDHDKVTTSSFLNWLERLQPAELLNLLSPHVDSLPSNILDRKNRCLHLLRRWDQEYFSKLDARMMEGLLQDAETKRTWMTTMSPEALFEEATNGIRQLPTPELEVILLVPQYHLQPTNTSNHYKNMIVCFYACDVNPVPSHQPHPALSRLLSSLADDNRLSMLKYMSKQSRSFTELVQFSGLAKSTVHHHLVALRASGLIRVTAEGTSHVTYSLRDETLNQLTAKLKEFIDEE
ncbi:ArsR/SmtB family transcription factor [Paenibacillus planticolens]|uniref:ArsR family transcriptional regulator n=1 Tax=Paenibacillus planticolens TaxID=2654976 RepID=A0ABX1ZYY7_9BACL|nr:metalloregulator ArsR/SmtB family transcription factor [Paenibacillus planticolens]NOV04207.1 ArsR family transcriptional regulator [Paenibacillus planticolens]